MLRSITALAIVTAAALFWIGVTARAETCNTTCNQIGDYTHCRTSCY
jgi:hypothetical protein